MDKPNNYRCSVFEHFCFRAVLGVSPDACLATPDSRSKMYASAALAARRYAINGGKPRDPRPTVTNVCLRAMAARRSDIKGVCLATPDPRSQMYASRTLAALGFAISMRLATPASRSKTHALAAWLQFALLIMHVNDTRYLLPLLVQINLSKGALAILIFH